MSLYDSLVQHEGVRLTVYDDATGKPIQRGSQVVGNPTIGIGTLICAPGGITTDEAQMLLRNRIAKAADGVRGLLPTLAAGARFDVLTEMAFQMGVSGLSQFSNTLQAVRDQRWDDAANGMLASKWATQTPGRAQTLAAIMRSGQP